MFNSNPYYYGGNSFNQQQRFQQPQQQTFSIIPVTSEQEATAFRVDMFGTPTFFFNSATNEVYLKRINTQTGMADFIKFAKLEQATSEENNKIGINTYLDKLNAIESKLDSLLPTNKNGAEKDVESNTINEYVAKLK